jgi:PAS domain S-box-containing protein
MAVHPDDRRQVLTAWLALEKGQRESLVECRFLPPGGQIRWVAGSAIPLRNAKGAITGFLGAVTDITAAKEAKVALEQSEERFRTAFDYAGIGMALVGLDGSWLKTNRVVHHLLDYSEEELLDRKVQDMTHPEDWDADQANMQELRDGRRRHYQMEKRFIRREGQVVHVRVTVTLVCGAGGVPLHFIVQIEDITQSKRMMEALAESEERTRLFAEHAPASVAMFDRGMHYLVHSAKWLKDYGLNGRNIIGVSHYDVFPEIGEKWKEIHCRCLAGATEVNEADLFERADGTQQWLSWRVQPWRNAADEIGGIVMFTEDITRWKELENSLAAARDQALAASKMKSEFLANVSHEIRTPMNGVLGMADLLMDTALTEDQRQMGGIIQGSARNLLAIIDDLLDFSKIEAGKFRITVEEFSLGEQVDQALALMAVVSSRCW